MIPFPTSYLMEVYASLLFRYGDPEWWPGDTPIEIALGAILTQNTSWNNVERSLSILSDDIGIDAGSIAESDLQRISKAIRSSGYYNQKAVYIRDFCRFIIDRCDGDLTALGRYDTPSARAELLSLRGVGEETADSILCYALTRPVMVIDSYTRRFMSRLDPSDWTILNPERRVGYHELQSFLEARLRGDVGIYNRFHALIVLHSKDICSSRPHCDDCPIADICATGLPRN